MSIIIKGVRMPSECRMCPLCQYYMTVGETRCRRTGEVLASGFGTIKFSGRSEHCQLAELPEKHGRLLDENDVIDAIHARLRELQTHEVFIRKHGDIDLLGVFPYIAKIKAVVEAEGEE